MIRDKLSFSGQRYAGLNSTFVLHSLKLGDNLPNIIPNLVIEYKMAHVGLLFTFVACFAFVKADIDNSELEAKEDVMSNKIGHLEKMILELQAKESWLPDGYSRIFRIVCVWPFGLLDYGSATLRCKI